MHCTLLVFVAILNIGSLKTEPIELSRNSGRMSSMLPHGQRKAKVTATRFEDAQSEAEDEPREWNVGGWNFRPDRPGFRRFADVDDDDDYEGQEVEFLQDHFKSIDQLSEEEMTQLRNYLVESLQHPVVLDAPLIMVSNSPEDDRPSPVPYNRLPTSVAKRARLYMQYPWKRQNSRTYTTMDYDACSPSRHDVFQLLTALHEVRQGNKPRFIRFCNRQRPANAVYTNIRFLGRKRK